MATRSAILDAAQSLVQTRGSNGMSYEDISSRVGIRKASIHYHFATKADLIAAVIERYSGVFLDRVDEILRSDASGRSKLERYVALFEQPLREGHGRGVCLCGMLASELGTLDEKSSALVKRFYRKGIGQLSAVLESGRRDGTLQLSGDPRRLANLIFSTLEGALITARVEGGVRGFRVAAKQLCELLAGA